MNSPRGRRSRSHGVEMRLVRTWMRRWGLRIMKPAESVSRPHCRANSEAASRRHIRSDWDRRLTSLWKPSSWLLASKHASFRGLLVPRKGNFGYTEEPILAYRGVKLHAQPWNDSHNGRWRKVHSACLSGGGRWLFIENHLEARNRGARRQEARFKSAEESYCYFHPALMEETWRAQIRCSSGFLHLLYGDIIGKMNVHALRAILATNSLWRMTFEKQHKGCKVLIQQSNKALVRQPGGLSVGWLMLILMCSAHI